MAGVVLKGIRKSYDGKDWVVKDFNIDINDGEFIVLVGPSGCGKTTTLRMIAGLEEISQGELYIEGRLVNDIEPKDRDIAMVFQNYALYPHMTVYENMSYGLKLKKEPKSLIYEKVKSAAQILKIEDLLDRKPKSLSGGQRQRVALGRAMVRQPKVFLMDEPLSNLDAKLRVQMRVEIEKLHKRLETTFIYVTHDQTEALTMGTRIIVMKDGYIQQINTPQNVYNYPSNMFVASFIGSPQINILDGVVIEKEGNIVIELMDKTILQISEDKKSILKENGYVSQKVYIGIRPEHLKESEVNESNKDYSKFSAIIENVELLGAEKYLYISICGRQVIARVDASTMKKEGDTVELRVHKDKIYLFNAKTEENIL